MRRPLLAPCAVLCLGSAPSCAWAVRAAAHQTRALSATGDARYSCATCLPAGVLMHAAGTREQPRLAICISCEWPFASHGSEWVGAHGGGQEW
eukprot:150344-Chlamydomonas_euryale.AAC.1